MAGAISCFDAGFGVELEVIERCFLYLPTCRKSDGISSAIRSWLLWLLQLLWLMAGEP